MTSVREHGPGKSRAEVASLLRQVVDNGRTTDQLLASNPSVAPPSREILLGSLRHFFSLAAIVDVRLARAIKGKARNVYFLLIAGAYQLIYMRTPAHAVVNESVAATRVLGVPWMTGLVNAVMRALANEPTPANNIDEQTFDHPEWLLACWRREYPDRWQQLAQTQLQRAPMCLRINRRRTVPSAYRARLTEAGIEYRNGDDNDATVTLSRPVPPATLPGFQEGLVSVQDAGAQRVAQTVAALLPSRDTPTRLLDACAAPGGKAFAIAEFFSVDRIGKTVDIVALDISDVRLAHMTDELRRLDHHDVAMVCGDATGLGWWDGQPFDAILADVPCSGTGTLRRHPDIKVLRRDADIAAYAALQHKMLASLWHTLKPGGTLLYSTCSLLEEENEAVIRGFLERCDDATANAEVLRGALADNRTGEPADTVEFVYGVQLLPQDGGGDGYYVCVLERGTA